MKTFRHGPLGALTSSRTCDGGVKKSEPATLMPSQSSQSIRVITKKGGQTVRMEHELVQMYYNKACTFRNRNGPARPSAAGCTRPPGHSRVGACAAGSGGCVR